MMGFTHIMIGFGASSLMGNALDIKVSALPWFAVLFGSVAPDIDEPSSTMSKPGTLLRPYLPRGICAILDGIGKIISTVLNKLFGHRGVTHSFIIPVIIFAAARGLQLHWLYWFAACYALHIFADLLTYQGIPIFSPISNHLYSLGLVKTGSWKDRLLSMVSGITFIIALISNI